MFADLFPTGRGRPSVPADVMASVITLQALLGLSDSETVDAVTFDLRWKTACGMPVTAAAFHPTTLTYWRRRLAASDQPNRIFEAVKAVVAQTGALAGRTRRALDSTVLDDAVATQDTVIQLIGAIRRVRREVTGAAEVIEQHCSAHDYDDPGKPAIAWNDAEAREQLVDALVSDAHRLLGHLPEQDLGPRAAEAVALLALVAGQDVEPVEDSDGTDGRWRIAQQVAPDRVISTVDPDSRHVHKTVSHRQDGFKAHVAVEPDSGIITDCALTKAAGADNHEAAVALQLLDGEVEPVTVLADSATAQGNSAPNWPNAAIPTGSSPHRCRGDCQAGSRWMTSPSTTQCAPRPAPTGGPERSPAPGGSPLARPAPAVHCVLAAPAAAPAELCGSGSMMRGNAPRDRPLATHSGWPNTASTDPWSNAPSPG